MNGHEEKAKFMYPVDHMIEAFKPERIGGISYITVIGGGETLIPEEVVPFVKGLLHQGHVVEVVTNNTLDARIDELLDTPKEDLERLIIKCSLHYLELKRLGKVDSYFGNIRKIVAAGASSYPFLVICQEYMEYLDEICDTCSKELGVMPQCTPCVIAETREDFLGGSAAATSPRCTPEFVAEINKKFGSKLFKESVRFLDINPKEIFCYAGEWSFVVEMGTGIVLKCHNVKTEINFFQNIAEPICCDAVGCECGIASCSLQYGLFGFGLIPEVENVPTYAEMICDREGLFQEKVKELLNVRISDIKHVMTPEEKTLFLMRKITEKNTRIDNQVKLMRRFSGKTEESEREVIEKVLHSVDIGQINYEESGDVTYRHLKAIMEICDTMMDGELMCRSVFQKIFTGIFCTHDYEKPDVIYDETNDSVKAGILKMAVNVFVAEQKNVSVLENAVNGGNYAEIADIMLKQVRKL